MIVSLPSKLTINQSEFSDPTTGQSQSQVTGGLSMELQAMRTETRESLLLSNDNEQYSRLNNLRFCGLKPNANEECRVAAARFIRDVLQADKNGYKFLKLVMDCYLEQHVCLPTRLNNILDLILTNELPIKDGIGILAPVDNSDHYVLLFSIECNNSQDKEKRQFSYNQADYTAMHEFVQLRLSDMDLSDMSASTLWFNFNEIMQEAIKRFVP